MRVLVACEFSGVVRDAFAAKGHDAWSCDLLPSERNGKHVQGNVLDVFQDGWDLMVAHPPCTYLCNSGVCWLHTDCPKRWISLFESARFFNELKNAGIEKIAIENPIPHGYAKDLIGNYSQVIQPFHFGHAERKATCFWLKGLEPLKPTNMVMLPAEKSKAQRLHYASPGPDRWKIRSKTFTGIAEAMADQWGNL
jgi:hypothetical protein